jgi:Protein of unknown function (DUF3800)
MSVEARPNKYRLYVDEVGNHDLDVGDNENERYLSLTGVLFELEYVAQTLGPRLGDLKTRYFGSHPDQMVVLHRKELVQRRYPFQALRDPTIEAAFNDEFLGLLADLEFKAITVTLDKAEHVRLYQGWAFHPYHYAMRVLVERYVLELRDCGGVGDVMAEGRGGREDLALKEVFRALVEHGFANTVSFRSRLTSLELKVKRKADNIPGLQIADLVAHPAFKATQCVHAKTTLPNTFGGRIAEILLDSKFRRSRGGKIDAYGTKWLP